MSKPADFLKWKMIQAAGQIPEWAVELLSSKEVEVFLGTYRYYYLYGGASGVAAESKTLAIRSWASAYNCLPIDYAVLAIAQKRWKQYQCLQKQTS